MPAWCVVGIRTQCSVSIFILAPYIPIITFVSTHLLELTPREFFFINFISSYITVKYTENITSKTFVHNVESIFTTKTEIKNTKIIYSKLF